MVFFAVQKSKVADKAKHPATIINKASMSIDKPTTPKLKTLANVATSPPPLSFPEQLINCPLTLVHNDL